MTPDRRFSWSERYGLTRFNNRADTRWTCWRNGRDSNPRTREGRPLSRRLQSSTLPPFRRSTIAARPALGSGSGRRPLHSGLPERCQSGRMGRPAKALIVMRSVGSNPTLSATSTRPGPERSGPVRVWRRLLADGRAGVRQMTSMSSLCRSCCISMTTRLDTEVPARRLASGRVPATH